MVIQNTILIANQLLDPSNIRQIRTKATAQAAKRVEIALVRRVQATPNTASMNISSRMTTRVPPPIIKTHLNIKIHKDKIITMPESKGGSTPAKSAR